MKIACSVESMSNEVDCDSAAFDDYISRNVRYYMTDFEKQCVRLGILREKANVFGNERLRQFSFETWSREGNQAVEIALADGVVQYQIQIEDRVRRRFNEGCCASTVVQDATRSFERL